MSFSPFEIGVGIMFAFILLGIKLGDHDRENNSWFGGLFLVALIVIFWLLTYGPVLPKFLHG